MGYSAIACDGNQQGQGNEYQRDIYDGTTRPTLLTNIDEDYDHIETDNLVDDVVNCNDHKNSAGQAQPLSAAFPTTPFRNSSSNIFQAQFQQRFQQHGLSNTATGPTTQFFIGIHITNNIGNNLSMLGIFPTAVLK